MLQNEKRKLISIPFNKMLKLEVPQMAEQVIAIVDKHEPETLKIDGAYNLLVAKQPHIDKLFVWYRSHPLTKELQELRKTRRFNIRKVSFQLEVVIREDVSGMDKSVYLVKSQTERFISDFNSSNEEVKCRRLTQFFELIDANEELEEALTKLKFSDKLDELRSVHSNILELMKNKLTNLSYRPIEKTPFLKKSVLNSTKNMFLEIELAILKYPEIDYQPLINELNVLLNTYNNLINSRALKNNRKAEKAKGAEKETAPSDSSEISNTMEPSESTPQTLSLDVERMNGNSFSNSNNSVDNKKAAATPSKPLQLPPMNNEDEV